MKYSFPVALYVKTIRFRRGSAYKRGMSYVVLKVCNTKDMYQVVKFRGSVEKTA